MGKQYGLLVYFRRDTVSKRKKSAAGTVGVMMAITMLGKVLGLFRDRLLTVNYGSSMAANAFLTASRIPRVFFDTVFASAISACLIPVFGEALQKRGKGEALRFAGNFITVMALLCALMTILGTIFAAPLTNLFADGYDAATAELCTKLTRIMMPTVFFTGIAFSFVGILQSFDEFNIPAAISLVSNVAVILYYYTFNSRFGIEGLAAAFLVAWLLQALVQVPALIKKGFRFYPSLSLRSEGMRKVWRLLLPVMVSTWVLPINQTINSNFGSRLFNGAGVAAVELSYNLYTVIAGVFVLSVTNYIFPRLARENAQGDRQVLRGTLRGSLHSTLFVVAPMTAGLSLMAGPLINFIYGGGEFDAFSVSITSRALAYMSLGMIGYAVQAVLSRAYFAGQSGGVPLAAGAVSIGVNLLLCELLTKRFDVAGIAVASAVSFAVNALVLALPLKARGLGFFDGDFIKDMIKLVLATVVMSAAVLGVLSLLEGRVGKLMTLLIPTAAGAAVYFAASAALGVSEMGAVLGTAKKLLRKAGGRGA